MSKQVDKYTLVKEINYSQFSSTFRGVDTSNNKQIIVKVTKYNIF